MKGRSCSVYLLAGALKVREFGGIMRLRSAFLIVVGLLMSGVGMPVQALDFDKELSRQEAQVRALKV